MPGRPSPAVLVVADDVALMDEIVRHLEEIPHWRLVGSARSAGELLESDQQADAVLISEGPARDLAGSAARPSAPRLVVVAREPTVEALRAAIDIGARGFVEWPRDQRRLRPLVEEGLEARGGPAPGRLTAIWGPKGGSGTSVLAAHLAGALSVLEAPCLLVDLDLEHGDQAAVLGASGEIKTFLDLLPVIEEISPAVIESIAWRHPKGFGAILSPGSPGESGLVKAAEVMGAVGALGEFTDHVVADLPSGFADLAFAAAEQADRLLMVITPDVLSLRRGREAMKALRAAGIEETRVEVVLNRRGGEISAADIEAVLSRPVVAQIRPDPGLLRAPDRGELARSGLRLLSPLARRVAGLPHYESRRRRGG